jgi:hypothetical protein
VVEVLAVFGINAIISSALRDRLRRGSGAQRRAQMRDRLAWQASGFGRARSWGRAIAEMLEHNKNDHPAIFHILSKASSKRCVSLAERMTVASLSWRVSPEREKFAEPSLTSAPSMA